MTESEKMEGVLTDDEVEYAENVARRRYDESTTENARRLKIAEELALLSVAELEALLSKINKVIVTLLGCFDPAAPLSDAEKVRTDELAEYYAFEISIDQALVSKRREGYDAGAEEDIFTRLGQDYDYRETAHYLMRFCHSAPATVEECARILVALPVGKENVFAEQVFAELIKMVGHDHAEEEGIMKPLTEALRLRTQKKPEARSKHGADRRGLQRRA
jgi:hypothetical protein